MKQWTLQKKIFLKFLIFFFIFFSPVNSELIISGKAVITDGDTLNISSNKIRLSGIDAPEIKQTCKKSIIRFCNHDSYEYSYKGHWPEKNIHNSPTFPI